ncbi:MAG: hypothetical protein GY869_03215 [Planctomycetes bacterium]|nr:hypothetical protein [Planctomycetota bacterium]
MKDFTINIDKRKLANIQNLLIGIKQGMGKAMSRGINQTAKSSRALIIDSINNDTGIKKPAVKAAMKTTKASYRKWKASHFMTGKRISLAKFGPRLSKTTGNISYQISEDRGKKTIKYDRKSNRVFLTKGRGRKVLWVPEGTKDIVMLFGPSIPYALDDNKKLSKVVKKHIKVHLFKNISRMAKGLANGTIKK